MGIVAGSKIRRLLGMKGHKRLEIENNITTKILEQDEYQTPGVRLKFLESKKKSGDCGEWIEYSVLLEVTKWSDNADYLSYVFKNLGKVIKNYNLPGIDSIGLDEVDCGEAEFIYILLYILSNGKETKESSIYELD